MDKINNIKIHDRITFENVEYAVVDAREVPYGCNRKVEACRFEDWE